MMQQYRTQNMTTNQPVRGLRSFRSIRIMVEETEHVVLIDNGAITKVLDTGVHQIRPRYQRVVRLPATERQVTIPGQEMLTADGAAVRTTLVANATITDPVAVVRRGNWYDALYLKAQLAIRRMVASMALEELLAARAGLDTDLTLALTPEAEALGLELAAVNVRDLIVPGELKRAVADVVAARLTGQAALERARGETAALRSLANAAKAVADNPALLQLRLIQQMEQSTGNTYVVGAPPLLEG